MTKEEKAKAYDEALERARRIKNGEGDWRYSDLIEIGPALTEIFPELRESEDERIRKWLIDYYSRMKGHFDSNPNTKWLYEDEMPCKDILTWLEKQKELPTNEEMLRTLRTEYEKGVADTIAKYEQKEQKPPIAGNDFGWIDELKHDLEHPEELDQKVDDVLKQRKGIRALEWSDEDNIGWDEAFACVTRAEKAAKNEEELQNAVIAEKWLKEIKFKYYVHPVKQEWSKEDKYKLNFLTGMLEGLDPRDFDTRYMKELSSWLKSLSERFSYKTK